MRALVVGAGYVGFPLCQALRQDGYTVTGWVATEASEKNLKQAEIACIRADLTDASSWGEISRDWDVVFYSAAPNESNPDAYRKIYLYGLQQAINLKPKVFVYTSSTSVYGQNDGSDVDENALTQPDSVMGKILIKAEEMVISAGGNIARLSAIYGPNRGVIFRGLMAGIKELPGPADRWINQVHRDDIVRALLLIAQKNPCGVFNVCDDEPVRLEDMCNWVCETFQKTMPKFNGEHSERRRSITNKRILNHKLKKLGWELQYPSFREGYAQVLASQSV